MRRLTKEEITCEPVDEKVIRDLMSMIGDKWSLCVIGTLARSDNHRARFSELERKIEGISQRMLSTTLKNLERDGILTREVFPEVPPRVEYELTELGHSLTFPIKTLVDWIVDNASVMYASRETLQVMANISQYERRMNEPYFMGP